MANILDMKLVVKHLVNGTLADNLCVICLMPLGDGHENIFTRVCKEDKDYCIADVLQSVCHVEFLDTENYNVCINCFISASVAYKFYLLTKRSQEILNFYSDALTRTLDHVNITDVVTTNSLCIPLPIISSNILNYDYDLKGIGLGSMVGNIKKGKINEKALKENDDDEVVVVIQDGQSLFFRQRGGKLVPLSAHEKIKYDKALSKSAIIVNEDKPIRRRKRHPMTYKCCSRCPVKYRFIAKLMEHMKAHHNVILYVCKVCKAMTEDEQEYHNHLRTHTNIHQCAICNIVYKRRQTMIMHLKWHEKKKNLGQTKGAHVCEICGDILGSDVKLKEHYHSKHENNFTCFYCGRMYKGELSFEAHIKKHEAHLEGKEKKHGPSDKKMGTDSKAKDKNDGSKKRSMCNICGRYFVDERALLWHHRLHNNERPYNCDVCGRGFVSLNRRNQHAQCAHTPPQRRCPLCPALFHLRSMVNTHIKKVHLKAHKRRNRTNNKHQNVPWRTETVPIQELSVSIQNDILELQAAKKSQQDWNFIEQVAQVEMEEEP